MTASPDSIRDAYALLTCSITDDAEGARVILANCGDTGQVAGVLSDTLAEAIRAISRVLVSDGDPLTLVGRMRDALAEAGEGGP